MDNSGSVVIPASVRRRLGLKSGNVEFYVDDIGLHIVPKIATDIVVKNGFLVIPAAGVLINDDDVRKFKDFDQK